MTGEGSEGAATWIQAEVRSTSAVSPGGGYIIYTYLNIYLKKDDNIEDVSKRQYLLRLKVFVQTLLRAFVASP